MANQAQSANLDTTIAALQKDPTTIPANDAITIIENWQQQLQGHDIAEDLGELKEALQSGDAEAISEILTDLGEDTSGVASDLPADVAAKVQQLGALLLQAGQSTK